METLHTESSSISSDSVSDSFHSAYAEGRSSEKSREGRHGALYWRFFINLALMLLDASVFLVVGATVVNVMETKPLRQYTSAHAPEYISLYLVISAVVWVLCLNFAGVYHRHVMGDGYQLNTLMFKGAVFCWCAMCTICFVFGFAMPLAQQIVVVGAVWLADMAVRAVARVFLTRDRQKGKYAYATVVVGSAQGIANMLRFLGNRSQLNYRPVAVCPIRVDDSGTIVADDVNEVNQAVSESWGTLLPVVIYDQSFEGSITAVAAQTVMVCDVLRRDSDLFNTFSVRVESMGLELAVVTSALDVGGHELHVRNIQGVTVLTISLPQYTPFMKLAKRTFDVVISLVALVVSIIVTIPTAIAIKIEDGGPVFYTQERVGLRGKPFRMIKFRSMVVNADAQKSKLAEESGQSDRFIFKMKEDPRVTKVGRFIRRFSIDELPQLINVLKGDMSMVGPRPPLPEEVKRYNSTYATRMFVKPGITGPWQVSGRSDLSAEESERLDVNYVQNWSLTGDIVLLFRTVGAVLSHKGAY